MSTYVLQRKAAFEKRRAQRREVPVTTYYLDGYLRHLNDTPLYREACAHDSLLSQIDLPLYPEEGIVGCYDPCEPVCFYYGNATVIDTDLAERFIRERGLSDEAAETFRQQVDAVRQRVYRGADPAVFSKEEMDSIRAHAATSTWFGGHMVLDFDTILHRGLDDYQQQIDLARPEHPGQEEFYAAMETMLHAIRIFIHRYAEAAAAAAQTPPFDRERFTRTAQDLLWVEHHRPQNFRQALQLLWIIYILNGADSFGRFDRYLWDFYRQDIESGVLTKEQAFDHLGDLFIKIEEIDHIQNMTIGGLDENGDPAYTDLTELCIRVAAFLKYKGPNLCLRVNPQMPQRIWDAAMDCLGLGLGIPALYNEEIYIDGLTGNGIPREAANDFTLAGCSQTMIPGRSNFYNDVGILNAAKVFELALYDGFDTRTGHQVGLHTGEPAQLDTFEKFYDAVNRQIDYFCDLEISINDKDVLDRAAREGYTMRTLFMRDCIGRAKPIFAGGARYNNIELEVLGITNLADSLYAVRKVVYEQKLLTLTELTEVLRADFVGYEDIRKKLLDVEKFGNDCEELDALRGEVSERIFGNFNRKPTVLGGVSVPGEVIFIAHEYAGLVTGATPDGRRCGTVLADSAGASQGQDRKGPTALLNSVLKIPVQGHLLTSVVLNVKFLAPLFNASRDKVRALFEAFFAGGGMQVQVNVVDPEELEDALVHPEAHRSLVVRVGGYSDYFVRLSPALQREIIRRTAQDV